MTALRTLAATILLVAAALWGCAAPAPEKFPFRVPGGSPWPDLHVHYVQAGDGTRLAYRDAGDARSSRALILVPGSSSYGYYYVPFLQAMGRDGLYVRVIDLRGHGDSDGPRGDVPDEDALVDDLALHIRQVRGASSGVKIFLAGHSMGAGVCGRYLEKQGYRSVAGAVYLAPFFHYRQPGMKPARYVDVDILKTVLGGPHAVTQVYHPASDDPKLVRAYTKAMSRASMVSDYGRFREDHRTPALYLIGKEDELFDWQTGPSLFRNNDGMEVVVLDGAAHLDVPDKGAGVIAGWIARTAGN